MKSYPAAEIGTYLILFPSQCYSAICKRRLTNRLISDHCSSRATPAATRLPSCALVCILFSNQHVYISRLHSSYTPFYPFRTSHVGWIHDHHTSSWLSSSQRHLDTEQRAPVIVYATRYRRDDLQEQDPCCSVSCVYLSCSVIPHLRRLDHSPGPAFPPSAPS